MRLFRHFRACALALACAAMPLAAGAEGPAVGKIVRPDDRAFLRTQIETELAHRRARLAVIEQELQNQSKRYDEMAAHKMELAKLAAAQAEAAKEAAAQKAMKAQLAAARSNGGKPAPKPGNGKSNGANGANGKAGDAKDAAGAAGAEPGAKKPIDPLLTQNYLVLRLRDEARQLSERVSYLEGVLAKLQGL